MHLLRRLHPCASPLRNISRRFPWSGSFNCDRAGLDDTLRLREDDAFGEQVYRGIPFALGNAAGEENVILLDGEDARIAVDGLRATYLIFAHIVEDRPLQLTPDLADYDGVQHRNGDLPGNDLGDRVAEYSIEYADGSGATVPIHRRFAIQQATVGWGASAFEAVPHRQDMVNPSVGEALTLGKMPKTSYGDGETRHGSGRDEWGQHLWLYALPNPHPEKAMSAIHCAPKDERAVIFGISATLLEGHPLRWRTRQKLALTLPETVKFNALGELDDIDIDLGTVISARAKLEYERADWFGDATNAQPTRSERVVIIEFAAHPDATLHLRDQDGDLHSYDLRQLAEKGQVEALEARRLIKVKVVDERGQPVAVRIHFHGGNGEYLPPLGNHRRVNPYWFEDNYGEFVNSLNQYAYIHGHCEVEVPLGEVLCGDQPRL